MSSDSPCTTDATASHGNAAIKNNKHTSRNEKFEFGPWIITTRKSHILQSKCTNANECKPEDDDCTLEESQNCQHRICPFCRYERELALPKLPDMVFAENILRIEYPPKQIGVEFNALDALKLVDATRDSIKVAVADAWREARADSEYVNDVVKPFDWTFTTKYKGSVFSSHNKKLKITETTQRIDVEKLKRKEKILFYDDIHLFEDELADNGCAFLRVKIRVMPSGFFLLQRFYLRVDNVLVRIHDTRLHYQADEDYLLREFSVRESTASELKALPSSVITNADEVWFHLKLIEEEMEKLQIPV